MTKSPFERVFSLIERKKLLQRVAKEKTKILVKSSRNDVLDFQVFGIDEAGNLEGQLSKASARDFEKVTALFHVESDRYFLTTRLKKKNNFWVLFNDTQLFKLNRRSAFRVHVPLSVELTLYISTIRNIEINKKVTVLEFSSTGARIQWFSEKGVSKGTLIKGSLQWGKGKVLPVEGTIVHNPIPGVFAIRFVNMNAISQNRLKMLSIEIQQTIHFQKPL